MATANTTNSPSNTGTGESNVPDWLQGDSAQNLYNTLLQLANRENQPSQGNTANTAGNTSDLVAMLQGAAPGGMDFGAYLPLLSAIGDQSFTKDAAIQDSQGMIAQIFSEYEKGSLPQIYKNARATGVYNDTSTQLLANDAYSSAVAKGQSQLVQNILAYSQARSNQLNPVLALLNGQVSNANAVTGATVQNNSLIANATQNGINQANVNGSAPQAPNTDIPDAAAIIGSLYGIYNEYQASQAPESTTNNTAPVVNSDPYADNLDDEQSYY